MPELRPGMILSSEKAIAYSFHLLLDRGIEKGLMYDNASYTQVKFPNGDDGAFVAIGFSGIARGYQFLYRIKSGHAELFNLSGWDWGIRDLQQDTRANIEFLELFPRLDNKQVFKLIGAGHAGTGLWTHGYFQIIEITDSGVKVIFDGAEVQLAMSNGGYHRQYEYQYVDLDDDGTKEIIKRGQECQYFIDRNELKRTNCMQINELYRFDGNEYVRHP